MTGTPNPWAIALLVFVTAQRLAEMVWARRNETRQRAAGAVELGAAHYPLIVGLHASWLVALWVLGRGQPLSVFFVVVFFILQGLRVWVLATLGGRWTTRVFVTPGETLVARGPYRFIPHPNYAVVLLEIPALPLAFHLPVVALVFGLLNLAMLAWRIRVEERGLKLLAAPRL